MIAELFEAECVRDFGNFYTYKRCKRLYKVYKPLTPTSDTLLNQNYTSLFFLPKDVFAQNYGSLLALWN